MSSSCIAFLASFDTSHRRHSRELIRVTLSRPLLARLLRPWTLVVPPPKDIESERDLVFSLASSLLQSPVGQGRGSSVISLAHRVGRGSRGHASFPLGESCLSIPRFPLSFFIGGKDGGGKDLCSRDMYKIGTVFAYFLSICLLSTRARYPMWMYKSRWKFRILAHFTIIFSIVQFVILPKYFSPKLDGKIQAREMQKLRCKLANDSGGDALRKRPPQRFDIRYVVAIEDINATLRTLNGGFCVCYQPPFYDYLVALLPLDPPLSG